MRKKETVIGYKWITDDWKSSNGTDTPWEMGVWKEVAGKLEKCRHGYHACRSVYESLEYIYGNRLVVVEAEGIKEDNYKFVARRMRVICELSAKEIMTDFAVACAKNVLYLYEQKYPNDDIPRKAIEVTNSNHAAVHAAVHAAHAAYAAAYADDAAHAAYAAAHAAYAAAHAAYAAAHAAYAAAHAAAYAVHAAHAIHAAAYAVHAAYAAAYAVHAADAAAYAVHAADAAAYAVHAADAAAYAERKWQKRKLEQIINKYNHNLDGLK